MSRIEQLLVESKKLRPGSTNISVKKWTPLIVDMRNRNFTWKEIWEFLRDQGETVHANWRTFAAGASRIHSNYLVRLAKREGAA